MSNVNEIDEELLEITPKGITLLFLRGVKC